MRLTWLHECPGIGPVLLARVIERYKGAPPPEFFGRDAPWYREQLHVSPRLANVMQDHLSSVPARLATAQRLPIEVRIPLDMDYPFVLQHNFKPLPLLYSHGLPNHRFPTGKLCVVSSQKEELRYGEAVKAALHAAITAGWSLVAGHNRPVYQWALLAAKRAARPATLVLDRGLLAAFDEDLKRDPVPAARIWGYAFDSERMLALSPFRLYDPWIGANARIRDAIIVALSEVVIAIGVREGGTMHRLCAEAAGRGQTVLASADCLPLLQPHGARAWTGELPRVVSARPSPGEIG